jgi:hypothetical protein
LLDRAGRVSRLLPRLEDGAARLGVQCLAISHHDVSQFDARFRVSRIQGEPASGVAILGPAAGGEWERDAPASASSA